MNILISGGTGFVGTNLVQFLQEQGHHVTLLTRKELSNTQQDFLLYPEKHKLLATEKIAEFQAIINLAGASIFSTKWNNEGKQKILDSRIFVTRFLTESIKNNAIQNKAYPHLFITTSATGFYGTSDEKLFDEHSPKGDGFLPSVAEAWEKQAKIIEDLDIRLVILRFGIVFGSEGMLKELQKPFHYHVGGYIGSKKQWISWIHIKDLVRIMNEVLQKESMTGIYNACSPQNITMKELIDDMAHVFGRKAWTRVPAFLIKILFGQMATELILNGQKVKPTRLVEEQFKWDFETVEAALSDIYKS